MKLEEREGFTNREIAAAIMNGDLEQLNQMLDGFGLRRDFPVFLSTSYRTSSIILSYASVFAGRSQISPEVARLLIDNLSRNVNIFLFLDTVLYFKRHDTRSEEEFPSREIVSILNEGWPEDEFGGRVAIMNENEYLSLIEYITSSKVETIPKDFSIPLVRYVYTHQMMPLTLLFAYMASSLREPDFNSNIANDIIGQILDGLMAGSDENE